MPRPPVIPSARFNIFQKLVRQWDTLHPYNGAQVVRLRAPLPPDLTSLWHQTLTDLGLGPVEISGNRYRFTPAPPTSPPPSLPSATTLDQLLTQHLNRPFTPGECPLRLLALPDGPSHFHLGIAYQHCFADSVSIRLVLHELVRRVLGQPPHKTTLRLSGGGYWKLFGPTDPLAGTTTRSWSLLRGLLTGSRQTSRMKRVRRVEGAAAWDYTAAFSSYTLPDSTLPRLRAYAADHRLKINDIFLAALAQAVADEGPLTLTSRRQDLALGTIVDLRPHARPNRDAPADLSNVFNLYLGFTTVFLRPHHLRDFDALTAHISRQHAVARANHAAASSFLRMAAGLAAHRLLRSDRDRREFYRKRLPLSGGVSNINLTDSFAAPLHPQTLTDYLRVSPTGPMMPLVISPTTLNQSLNFGLTHRTAIIPPNMATRIAQHIARRLESL